MTLQQHVLKDVRVSDLTHFTRENLSYFLTVAPNEPVCMSFLKLLSNECRQTRCNMLAKIRDDDLAYGLLLDELHKYRAHLIYISVKYHQTQHLTHTIDRICRVSGGYVDEVVDLMSDDSRVRDIVIDIYVRCWI